MRPSGKERRKVSTLSGGEKKSCAIARCYLDGANILILDEPTKKLDSENTMSNLESIVVNATDFLLPYYADGITNATRKATYSAYSDQILSIGSKPAAGCALIMTLIATIASLRKVSKSIPGSPQGGVIPKCFGFSWHKSNSTASMKKGSAEAEPFLLHWLIRRTS
ncbi:MAG: ATP-binding cassette domain-containing protein [bacterium]|nr:ATP-binding cassette domain-containing protein [bacterium]